MPTRHSRCRIVPAAIEKGVAAATAIHERLYHWHASLYTASDMQRKLFFSFRVCILYTLTASLMFGVGWLDSLAQAAQQKPPAKAAVPNAEKPVQPGKEVNPAQIELLETKVRFEANGDSRKEVHALVNINSELGVRQFAQLNFDFNRSFESVDIPLVHITHASGGTADILPSAITDRPNPAVVNTPAYQDVRVKSVRILGLQPGDTLEYRVIRTVSHHPLAPDFWLDHSFDRTGTITRELFEINLPGHLNSTSTMGNWHGFPPVVVYVAVSPTSYRYDASDGPAGRSIFQWEISATRQLPAPVDLDGAPAPDVLVSSFGDWYKVVGRLSPHFLDWTEQDRKEAKAKQHEFAPHARPGEELLQASYDFVSQNFVTVDLAVGATGFRLRPAKEILESSFATAEEKCSLLALFANLAGIQAEVVLTGDPETQKQFGRPTVFNHVFVVTTEKGKQLALDPALEVAPFGVVRADSRGKKALSLTLGDAGDVTYAKWLPLPIDLPFSASQRVNVNAALSTDGKLTAKVKYTMRGDNELVLRVAFHQSAKEKWMELAQLLSLTDGFRGQVTSVNASDPYATKEPFLVEYELEQPKFVDWSKRTVRIPALLPQLGLPDLPAKPAAGAAEASIELGTPLEVETRMTLQLPSGTTATTPTGTSVNRDYATYASQYSVKGMTLSASRRIHFLLRQIPGTRAADYNAFLRAVQSDEAQDFSLERKESSLPKTKSAAPDAKTRPKTASSRP